MRKRLIRALGLLLLAPCLGMVTLDHASAGPCPDPKSPVVRALPGATVNYDSTKPVCPPAPPPRGPAGAKDVKDVKDVKKAAPLCDLRSPDEFCLGARTCWFMEPMLPYDKQPKTPPPTPDAKWHVLWCDIPIDSLQKGWKSNGTTESVWEGAGTQSKAEQAITATGLIKFPSTTLSFSPPKRTFVNLDTWFWADLPIGELRGSSALGLVAIATPDRLEIDPGDGSGKMPPCAWATDNSDRCKYKYQRDSMGGTARGQNGRPAYKATGKAIWKLTFEQDGAPITIPGAPTEWPGPVMETAVVVGEIQTLVVY